MSLHNGIDTVSYISLGYYSETYGVGEEANIANLYSSLGLLEDAPKISQLILDFLDVIRSRVRRQG